MIRSLVPFALVVSAACALGCSRPTAGHKATPATSAAEPSAAIEAPGPSLYPLRLALHDQDGRAIGVDAFRGHPVLVSMFYGSCPVACPLIVSNVKRVEAQLSPAARADARVLLVSFDPEHDSPEALRAIAAKRGLDPARWTLATGPEDDVRQLAAALGVSYRKLPEGGFAHTSVITALDAEGRIVARVEGSDPELAPLVAAIDRAPRL